MGTNNEIVSQRFICSLQILYIYGVLYQLVSGYYTSTYNTYPQWSHGLMLYGDRENQRKVLTKPHFKSEKWAGKSLVHTCAETGCYGVLKAILNDNPKINDKNNDNNTPLHLACANKHPQIVKLLLSHKADVEIRNGLNDASIHAAAKSGCLDCLRLLVNYGADVNAKGQYGRTALHYTVINGDISMMIFLLKRKADKTVLDDAGMVPLEYATNTDVKDILEGIVDLDDVSTL